LSEGKGPIGYKPRERTTLELMNPDTSDAYVREQIGRFRSELHERFSQPLYAFATLAIGFAALGSARTTRQGRGTAMAAAGLGMLGLRVAGFWASSMAVRSGRGCIDVSRADSLCGAGRPLQLVDAGAARRFWCGP
jgi:lipopolysaccharide export system permease protein